VPGACVARLVLLSIVLLHHGERSKPDVPMTSVALAMITQPVAAPHGGQDRRRPAQQRVRGGGAGCF
jgi:hypothetical protein